MPPPPSLNKHKPTHHYRNNVFKKISPEIDIFQWKNYGMPPPLPWTNTSPLIITHACRDVGLSIGAWIESQKRNWVSLSCESSIVCSFGTLSSFLSSSILAGLIFPWSCAATAPENSHVQTPRCVSETLCHYSLYLPWWFLGLRRSCDSDIRLCF